MKRVIIVTIIASLMACGVAFSQKKSKPMKLKNESDSLSYVLGWLFGGTLNDPSLAYMKRDINTKVFRKAIESAMASEDMGDYYAAVQYLSEYETRIELRDNADRLERGGKFLAENAKKSGVQITSSGLQYEIEQEGNGEEYPAESSYITANVKGTTFDGHVFREIDEYEYFSSYMDDLPEGCAEGIMMMSPGAKYTLYLPHELAHGEEGVSWEGIKPYDVLVYEIELIAISDHTTDEEYNHEELPREAGDYLQLNIKEANDIRSREDMHAYHEDMLYAFSVGDYHYIHMEDCNGEEYMVVVDDSGKELQTTKIGDGTWQDDNVGVYEPLNKESKERTIVVICDLYNYHDGEMFSNIYSLSSDGTMNFIGSTPMEIVNDYYEDEKLSNSLLIYSVDGGLRFSFSNNTMKYRADDDSIHFPAEDIHYDYNYANGSFKIGGVASGLTLFKRQSLKRIVRGVNPEQIDVLAIGDLDSDGHVDVLYTRNDDSKIYINLCKDYKIVRKMALSIDSDFTIDRVLYNDAISKKGEICLYIYDGDVYQKVRYILKDDKLVEVERAK